MGIQGLLPLLKSIMLPIHIKDLQGCCVAVDTYSWLHKGALSCSKELCKGLPTSKHIDYCMHRVNLLRHYGINPILVFDGGLLPMKGEQENKRARTRKENLSRAMEHESNGNLSAAYECYQKAVDISPLMAYQLIQVLKEENISYVVAPYEADAQMTFLAVSKQVDAVITEDSDLIAFGCPRIIYKMDKFGQGVEFRYSKLQQNKDLSFTGFTNQMILEMCILSGCDYLPSLPGMGLKKGHALLKKFRTYDKVIKHLKFNSVAVSPLYEESFKKAIMTFQHQRVYDPVTEDIVHMTELPANAGEDLDFLGPETSISQDVAKGIARGDLDPFTKMPFQGEDSGAELVLIATNQLKKFKPESERKKVDLPAQKNLLTNYFCSASLEAKRNFRTPRVTPEQGSSRNHTLSCKVGLSMEAKSGKVNNLRINVLDSEDQIVVNPPTDSGDSGMATEAYEPLRSPCHGEQAGPCETDVGVDATRIRHGLLQNQIHKPCMTLHKERASYIIGGKMKTEKGDVIVRSSYFLHNYVKEIDQDNKNNLDEAPSGKVQHLTYDHASKDASDGVDDAVGVARRYEIARSSYFQQQSPKESGFSNKNEKPLGEDGATFMQKYMPETCINGAKLKMSNRKVLVRSSYFQRNSINKNNQEGEAHDGVALDSCEDILPDNTSSSGNNPIEHIVKKRKIAPGNVYQTNDENTSPSPTDSSLSSQSNCISDMDLATTEIKSEEGKFGCNISHLGHYSEVAEKSMEKFVSAISSFRFTSTGSRASGLRAPLKDIRNTCEKRLSGNMDLSKYAYVQTKPKASSVHKG